MKLSTEVTFSFGQLSGDRPDPTTLERSRFRIAVLGDFSGRAARGQIEIGDDLAGRRAILLDPDTVEEVIEGFATTLYLPIGKDGAGIEVKLSCLDDLHPDELYENVELFSALKGLKSQLSAGATAESARQTLLNWGEMYGTPVSPPHRHSAGNTVPADLKLSDFRRLIGGVAPPRQESPLDEMLARIVGPHIHAVPDADADEMQKCVDQALTGAMRLVLHHPEFQSLEGQWRMLDMIARRIEVDDTLEVVLYDISAEEIATDLAAVADLSESGFLRLVTEEPIDGNLGRGSFSALIGLYTFEETPPHAELLGRIARVASHIDAPFISAITPTFLDVALRDQHPLVAKAWKDLRALPEAGHIGLISPRFLLRRPYGAKSEPIYEFEFEEFTMQAGLDSMLWANPAVLAAILLAQSFKIHGNSMSLGAVMSLGEIPFHVVNDAYGDQVALPCTERNLTGSKVKLAAERGYMPVISIKGRDEIRLGSFRSLAGDDILGRWSDAPRPPPSVDAAVPVPDPDSTLGESDADLPDAEAVGSTSDNDLDLDALLAEFADNGDDAEEGVDIDAELAALLEDL